MGLALERLRHLLLPLVDIIVMSMLYMIFIIGMVFQRVIFIIYQTLIGLLFLEKVVF